MLQLKKIQGASGHAPESRRPDSRSADKQKYEKKSKKKKSNARNRRQIVAAQNKQTNKGKVQFTAMNSCQSPDFNLKLQNRITLALKLLKPFNFQPWTGL